MRYLILLLLLPFIALGQGSPEGNSFRYKGNTNAQEAAYSDYLDGARFLWNSDLQVWRYKVGVGAWQNFDPAGEANTMSNLGGGEGVFAQKVGVDFQLKSIIAGSNITLSSTADQITINATGGGSGGSSNTVNQLSIGTNNADDTHLVTYNYLDLVGTATIVIPQDATYTFPVGTVLEYTSSGPEGTITLSYEAPATGPTDSTKESNGYAIAVQKIAANTWAAINTKTSVGVYSDAGLKTEATKITNVWEQTENGINTDGSPPAGEVVFCSDCGPAFTGTGSTVNLGDYYQYNFGAASNASTFTVTNSKAGGYVEVLVNRTGAPTVTGATLRPGTTAFVDATNMILHIKNYDGAVRYWFTVY